MPIIDTNQYIDAKKNGRKVQKKLSAILSQFFAQQGYHAAHKDVSMYQTFALADGELIKSGNPYVYPGERCARRVDSDARRVVGDGAIV